MEETTKKNYWLMISIIAVIIIVVDIFLLFAFLNKYKNQQQESPQHLPAVENQETTQAENSPSFSKPSGNTSPTAEQKNTVTPKPQNFDAEVKIQKDVSNCHKISLVFTKRQIGSMTVDIVGNISNIKVTSLDKTLGTKIINNQVLILPTKDAITSAQDLVQICFDSNSATSFKVTGYEFGTGETLAVNVK